MTNHVILETSMQSLARLIDEATVLFKNARTQQELLEAIHKAGVAYDDVERLERMAKSGNAPDDVLKLLRGRKLSVLELERTAECRLVMNHDENKNAARLAIHRAILVRARQACEAEAIKPGAIKEAIAKMRDGGGKVSRGRLTAQLSSARGVIKVPEGKTLVGLCRDALSLERSDALSQQRASKQVGLGVQTYSRVRNLLLLEEVTLSDKDRAIVERALAEINTTKRLAAYDENVAGIVSRVWGGKGTHTIKRQDKRVEDFRHSLTVISQACECAADLSVPYLSNDESVQCKQRLRVAVNHLNKLIRQFEKGGVDGQFDGVSHVSQR